jgi:hypothetical protein
VLNQNVDTLIEFHYQNEREKAQNKEKEQSKEKEKVQKEKDESTSPEAILRTTLLTCIELCQRNSQRLQDTENEVHQILFFFLSY